ncbi:uncharacterized protein LOC8055896 [Sorghum bicolor]|uniref:Uncharacterized protein n=1 Tax=Sorghum bicolor TaxID=4558 RepID=A0A1W0W5S8_SORBI|nr:uncharacterized protein LOC8055896 [Sorghum bicolor]OQU89730.1 hypothetical protein SORBI_3002G254100 [Sorghum bicolor]|eukprot:XP_002460475.2 uncharacterized protein LOC8055896 [Sorghum bicolor]
MALKFKAPGYIILKEEACCNKDNDSGKDGSLPIRNRYPRQHPIIFFDVNEGYDRKKINEFLLQWSIPIAKSRPNDIIIPDPAPQVPRVEVLEHVSSILKEYGFNPTGEIMDTINLRPYDCKMSDTETCNKGLINPNMAVMESDNLHAAEEKAVTATKEVGRGWDPTYMRRSFFPYWRSVLRTRCRWRLIPAYAEGYTRPVLDLQHFRASRSKSLANGSTPTPNHKLGLVGRISPLPSNQPRRAFSTAAISAFRLLKMLKYA